MSDLDKDSILGSAVVFVVTVLPALAIMGLVVVAGLWVILLVLGLLL